MNRNSPFPSRRRSRSFLTACTLLPLFVFALSGCTGSTAESAPVSDAEIKAATDRQTKAIQDDPKMPESAKRQALDHLQGRNPGERR